MVRLRHLLNNDGVLFGSTVLGRGARHSCLSQFIMSWHISWRVFENWADDVDSFVEPLKETFESVKWEVMDVVLPFKARNPRF